MASGETLSSVTGPYFTKYSDDHWAAPPEPAQSAVMFKDKEYPSASAALEAYIQQHEGRPGSFLPAGRPVEPVEELLTPHLSSSRAGFVDQVQAQRLQALKRMVDEAYQRLETQTLGRGVGGGAQTGGGQHVSAANQTLTESQRVLTCISPLPGVTPSVSEGTVSTDALLNVRPQLYPSSTGAARSSSGRRGFKTMQDYVEEARRAVVVDPAGVIQSPPIGSTARPTVLSVPPSSRQYANGGRSPPNWVKDLNGSVQTNPSPIGHTYPKSSSQRAVAEERGRVSSRLNYQNIAALPSQRWSQSKDDMYLLAEARDQTSRLEATSQLDKFSLTTDDLVYATPDGRSLNAMKFKSMDLVSPGRAYTSRPPPQADHPRTLEAQPAAANNMLSTMRRDFAEKLLREVEEGPSSIITGHLGDGGALNAYLSPILPSARRATAPGVHQPSPAYSPTKLRTLGLLTPETERLLSNPPRPGAMPGYDPSPVMPHLSNSSSSEGGATSSTSEQGVLPTESHDHRVDPRDLSADFTERVRALLLAPPGGEEQSYSPGGVSEGQRTEDILDGDREWERQPSYKPPRYVSEELSYGPGVDSSKEKGPNIVDSFLKECLDETDKVQQKLRIRRKKLVHSLLTECVQATRDTGVVDRGRWNIIDEFISECLATPIYMGSSSGPG